jgi:DNA replication and repair protein RecF
VRPLRIESLAVRGLRNLAAVDVAPGPRFNVFAGDNGQGKTNLLEAIYVVATSKSFRASSPGELVAHGGDLASVRAVVREADDKREQSVGVRAGARMVRIDGKRPQTLAAYAIRTPIVVFHPGEVSLSMGSGSERRRLLDRLSLYVSPSSMDDLDRYTRAMRARQRALEMRGLAASDLEQWEELMVRHGVDVMRVRAESAARLASSATEAFARIAAPGLVLGMRYARSAPEDAEAYRSALASGRAADMRRGGARIGPHKDDLALSIGEHPVRGVASQGQHRAVVLALKSAEIDVVGAARGARPILLLDDVSSELDRARTSSLFAFLRDQQGQVFLTTTRRELIDIEAGAERRDFAVAGGGILAW